MTPDVTDGPKTLDECESLFLDAIADERGARWASGDATIAAIGLNALHAPSAAEAKVRREKLIAHFASLAHVTASAIKQRALIAHRCEPGLRRLTKPWSWHRAAIEAAERLKRPLAEVLQEAERGDYGQRELRQLGKDAQPEAVRCEVTCAECGFSVRVTCTKPGIVAAYAGTVLPCPVCVARRWDDGGDGRDAARLGKLEGV